MARPKKKGADYFPHSKNLRNDRRVKALIVKRGLPGFAVYVMFLEMLCEADFHSLAWDESEKALIAGDMFSSPEEVSQVVESCLSLGLLSLSEEEEIFSSDLIEALSPLYEKRAKDRKRKGFPVENNSFLRENPRGKGVSPGNGTQRKVKESKEEERKVNEEGFLAKIQAELISKLSEFNSERALIWENKASSVGLDFSEVKTQFVNKLISEGQDKKERYQIQAGFDKYLQSWINNQNKTKNGKFRQNIGDTSKAKKESEFSNW
jgi:hypothetical protein